jgi:hypothetical protein
VTAPFDGWRTELVDLSRSGKLCEIGKADVIRALIECKGYLSQKKIVQMLGINPEL